LQRPEKTEEGDNVEIEDSDRQPPELIHLHICVYCGSAFRREEVEGRAHTTGLFLCPQCGVEGPLNIEIREINNPESQPQNAG
jgi:hypothetical protein